MSDGLPKLGNTNRAAWIVAIVLISTTLAMIVSWRAPGLNLYVRDRLMQARGPISPPDDIVIIAVDEASIARYGRFPWPRSLATRALDPIPSAPAHRRRSLSTSFTPNQQARPRTLHWPIRLSERETPWSRHNSSRSLTRKDYLVLAGCTQYLRLKTQPRVLGT